MKRIITKLLPLLAVLIIAAVLLVSCEPIAPPVPVESGDTGLPSAPPGAVTKVKSKWSGGDLDFTQNDGTVIMGLDGTNGDVEIATATITAGTAAALTITNLTAPTVSGTTTIADLVSTNATLTAPAVTGTTTINDFVADNVTITGGAISGATISVASPTITGTPVIANHASGNATLSSGTIVITHGLSGTPVIVLVTPVESGATDMYVTSVNSTNFTATSSNASATNLIYWIAYLENE